MLSNLSWVRKLYVQLAPDAFVFINGQLAVVVCPRCQARREIRQDITDISITNNISGSPGSATVNLVAPRHGSINEYYFRDGKPVFSEFSEIEIYMKGRFLAADEKPRYYPVFWGVISEVSHSYTGQAHSISLNCLNMLRWLELLTVNLRLSGLDAFSLGMPWNTTFHENAFFNRNIFDIVRSLFTVGLTDTYFGPGTNAFFNDYTGYHGHQPETPPGFDLRQEELDRIAYWQKRFGKLARALKILGLSGEVLTVDDTFLQNFLQPQPYESQGNYENGAHMKNYAWDMREEIMQMISQFRPFDQIGTPLKVEYSERISRLDLINQVKDMIGWEFFQDMNGECIFKPPFWNMDVRPNSPVSIIEDSDVINWDNSSSEARIVCTRLDIVGSMADLSIHKVEDKVQKQAFYIDYALAKQYGLRQTTKEARWLRNAKDCFIWAIVEMDRMNIERISGTLTIPGRPELRLGFPVYIKPLKMFYYISGITHSLSWSGQDYSTTLNLVAGRNLIRRSAINSLNTTPEPIELMTEDPKWYEKDLYRNGVLVYGGATNNQPQPAAVTNPLEDARRKLSEEEHVHHTEMGQWELAQKDVFTVSLDNPSLIMPYTDSSGFRVYGGFTWGRGLKVDSRGVIVKASDQEILTGNSLADESVFVDMRPKNLQTLNPGDTLLKFEDGITGVSQIYGGSQEAATLAQDSASQLIDLGLPLGLKQCVCKLEISDAVLAVTEAMQNERND